MARGRLFFRIVQVNTMKRFLTYSVSAAVAFSICSCVEKPEKEEKDSLPFERSMIMYSAGFTNINNYLSSDIADLENGTYIPEKGSGNSIFIVNKPFKGSYSKQTSPCIVRLYKQKGQVVRDTVHRFPEGTVMADAGTLRKSLEYIRDSWPSKSYGLVVSSHGTGWVPEGYYRYHKQMESEWNASHGSGATSVSPFSVTHEYGTGREYEMEIEDFAAAIPMHFDYMLFDLCLAGGAETAYALKDVTSMIGFSAAGILAEGFDYSNLASRLLTESEINVRGVCEDYFRQYDGYTGAYRSATIALVDCSGLDALAGACRDIFGKYGAEIAAVNPDAVQGFFTGDHHWYYDLEDIVRNAGVSGEDMDALRSALERCILYKAATESILGIVDINTFCGMSMYLPADGSELLDTYYRTLSWNRATGLVD